MTDIMLDLETWGLRPGCAVRSVGAVAFERRGPEAQREFYLNVTLESCLAAGLRQEPDTVHWWARQSAEARAALLLGAVPLGQAVGEFHRWFVRCGGHHVWSQGAGFDVPIWEAAAQALGTGEVAPWKFWSVRDTRTAYDLCGLDPRTVPRRGTHHNALADAHHQADCVRAALALHEADDVPGGDRQTVVLDFDGVIHSYTTGWQGADVIPDPPVAGAVAFICRAAEHFNVAVCSSRSHQPGGIAAMRDYLRRHGCGARVYFPRHKPPALVTIDDRAIQFTGVWPDIGEISEFRPWNKV